MDQPEQNARVSKNESFFLGTLLAVAGGSLFAGLHEIDKLLMLATPPVVLAFLTLVIGALVSALLATALRQSERLSFMRRMTSLSVAFLVAAYAALLISAWYGYFTDPDMLTEPDEDRTTVL